MNTIDLLAHPILQALGWGVLHFLWQGALLALMLKGMFWLFRFSPSARYLLSWSTLLVMLAIFISTTVLSYQYIHVHDEPRLIHAPVDDEIVRLPLTSVSTEGSAVPLLDNHSETPLLVLFQQSLAASIVWLAVGWALGFFVLLLKLIGGWAYLQYLIRTSVMASDHWQCYTHDLAHRLGMATRVVVRESNRVRSVFTANWLRPVILMPAGLLTGLRPDHLEAVLLHELAHIRRYDYVFNLIQSLIEAVLYFHPAVWWVSHQARIAREHRCDDIAVAACGNSLTYAKALTDAQSFAMVSLTSSLGGASLFDRVARLLTSKTSRTSRLGLVTALSCLLLLFAGMVQTPRLEAASPNLIVSMLDEVQLKSPLKLPPPILLPAITLNSLDEVQKEADEIETTAPVEDASPDDIQTVTQMEVSSQSANMLMEPVASVQVEAETELEAFKTVWDALIWRFRFEGLGAFQLNETADDISFLSPGGWLEIEEREWFTTRKARWQLSPGGQPERIYSVNGNVRTWNENAERWLQKAFDRLIQNGWAANILVKRRFEQAGVPGVLAMIESLKYSRAKWHYFNALGNHIAPEDVDITIANAIRDVADGMSDHDHAHFLDDMAKVYLTPVTTDVFFESVNQIHSDYFKAVLLQDLVSEVIHPADFLNIMQVAATIHSDFHKADTLIYALHRIPENHDILRAWIDVAATIGSDFHLEETLSHVFDHLPADDGLWISALQVTANVHSDFHKAHALLHAIEDVPFKHDVLKQLIAAAATIDSDFHQEEVLCSLYKRVDLSPSLWIESFDALEDMHSDFHKANVLLTAVKRLSQQDDVMNHLIQTAGSIDSAFHRHALFDEMLGQLNFSGPVATHFLEKVSLTSSDFYKGNTLIRFIKHVPLTPAIQTSLENAIHTIDSDGIYHEVSRRLKVEREQPLDQS